MKAGHFLATLVRDPEFDLTERERIRRALIDYMKAHRIGVPTLAERIKKSHPREMEIPWKTLQRFLGPLRKPLEEAPEPATKKPMKPTRTRDIALIICQTFVEKLPNKPTEFQALGQALHAFYKQPLPVDIAGPYDLDAEYYHNMLSISAPADGYALVNERSTRNHIYDGVIIATGQQARLVIMRDRLMLTPRYLMVSGQVAYVYEFSPFKYGGDSYMIYQARWSRS